MTYLRDSQCTDFHHFPTNFDAFWYMNNVFDLQHMVFNTNKITSKSLKFQLNCHLLDTPVYLDFQVPVLKNIHFDILTKCLFLQISEKELV